MKYYKITNADGKQWIMPLHNMSVGLQLYQPLSWKGKFLKRWFPLINRLDIFCIIQNYLHIERCDNPISKTINIKLNNIWGCTDIEFSVFNGTPCAHQKRTIQIYKGNKILGYCKVTDNPKLIDIFKQEKMYLNWLNNCGVTNIPKCLCCQEIDAGKWMFVQTTIKSTSSVVRLNIGKPEIDFLKTLTEKTSIQCRFQETDMYQWMKRIDDTSIFNCPAISKGLSVVFDYYKDKDKCTFSAYHSDFTPWNMFEEKNKLFVFDWEYAGRTYIPYLDLIHYIIQTSIFSEKQDANGLYDKLFVDNIKLLNNYFKSPRIAVICYLLDIIAKYAVRDNEYETKDTLMLTELRCELLTLILKNT